MWSRARLPDFAFQTDHEIEQPFHSQETIIMPRIPANGVSQNGKAKSKLVVQIALKVCFHVTLSLTSIHVFREQFNSNLQ